MKMWSIILWNVAASRYSGPWRFETSFFCYGLYVIQARVVQYFSDFVVDESTRDLRVKSSRSVAL
ncbi:hypothetical protein CC2G_004827 [Coprinopsis cinerea AmutBmut pab1-1]|nr:hypothetical protein CC2G_004827 [Coprinopsis cinerea AmutBmut pab1-1]